MSDFTEATIYSVNQDLAIINTQQISDLFMFTFDAKSAYYFAHVSR